MIENIVTRIVLLEKGYVSAPSLINLSRDRFAVELRIPFLRKLIAVHKALVALLDLRSEKKIRESLSEYNSVASCPIKFSG